MTETETACHADWNRIRKLARVPEHCLPLMEGMSGGNTLCIDNYVFYHGDNWLIAVAYPLLGSYSDAGFMDAFDKARSLLDAQAYFAIGPAFPASFMPHMVEKDRFYVLSARAGIPRALRNPVKRASEKLRVDESREFTAEHRRLWAEFMQRHACDMPGRVAELYSRTPAALRAPQSTLELLNAWDASGRLVASLLLDYGADNFTSYILGAHSRLHYVPHAADLLFSIMLKKAREKGKRFIHLGLGVNDGIRRFKIKWGARESWPFMMLQWEAGKMRLPGEEEINLGKAVAQAFLRAPAVPARQLLENQPKSRPFAMIWEVEKNGRRSWISGTAHFFCHSFEPSFRRLFQQADNVIFEGPLDADFMAEVDKAGKSLPEGATPLIEFMSNDELSRLERTVWGPSGKLARFFGLEKDSGTDVRWLLRHALPWCAFFSLWTAFLERHGWRESVDMEAWRIAVAMKKNVIGMETLEEQLESLGSLPVERVLRFFRSCSKWGMMARRNRQAYLRGDLEMMMGSSAEFPTRTEHVVGRRDQRFRERMRPYLEEGRAAVFVGTAHMVNLRHMLREDGFNIRQAPFGIWPKIHLEWRRIWRPDGNVTW